ncbi:MAG TPA: hypothetical protein VHU82_13585, partial [Vicinamibacterales bacterium]|nr:hypothetical protein [Vicinamibacterales bacterium]
LAQTLTMAAWCAAATTLAAAGHKPVDIPERARGAEQVVVATATQVKPIWRTNAFGDQLIVSQVVLTVHETLKGAFAGTVPMDLEGGTLDGVTLHVSSLPDLKPGERAVFFLDRTPGGSHVPHLKGLGILKLDQTDRVVNSSLQLNDIRQMVLGAK